MSPTPAPLLIRTLHAPSPPCRWCSIMKALENFSIHFEDETNHLSTRIIFWFLNAKCSYICRHLSLALAFRGECGAIISLQLDKSNGTAKHLGLSSRRTRWRDERGCLSESKAPFNGTTTVAYYTGRPPGSSFSGRSHSIHNSVCYTMPELGCNSAMANYSNEWLWLRVWSVPVSSEFIYFRTEVSKSAVNVLKK